ncbi:hypothetical protein EYF80_055121 [Liparis tanakae]|uniref:Uncharacterized protein n=1 Tax=Liparis tanakae TaxID=230148 RepID=A0A4Z2F0P3_9TELE|nr:hypothetical protein EYF80_055121 [Liparis tanakae]
MGFPHGDEIPLPVTADRRRMSHNNDNNDNDKSAEKTASGASHSDRKQPRSPAPWRRSSSPR